MFAFTPSLLLLFVLLSLGSLISPSISRDDDDSTLVPTPAPPVLPSKDPIFLYINQGDFQEDQGEFNLAFRTTGINSPKFLLCFISNFHQDAFTLGIGMIYPPKWVWAVNRNNPVHEGATLSLGKDGNLVLAEIDGRVVWQTNTANKGVVGIKLLENGNLVLYNSNNNFVWQSFDYPSDTLLAGQSLKAELTNKLVSRASTENNLEGNYILEMTPENVALYYKSEKIPNPLPYYIIDHISSKFPSKEFRFQVNVNNSKYGIYNLNIEYITVSSMLSANQYQQLAETWYNSEFSFLRLDYDGKLRTYTFDPSNRAGGHWKVEFTLFNGDPLVGNTKGATECQLPEKCGDFGVCYKDQCVACPSPRGLLGWSEGCAPPKLVECGGDGDRKNVKYYKVQGVEHFSSMYTQGDGPMKQSQCKTNCSKDCKCEGYFYHQESSMCWIVYDLKTLTQSGNLAHFGYVKMSK